MTRYACDRCPQWVEYVAPDARVTHECGPAGKRRRLRPQKEAKK